MYKTKPRKYDLQALLTKVPQSAGKLHSVRREQWPVDRPLTANQKVFAEELARGETQVTAAMRAGIKNYNNGDVSRLTRQPNIQKAIADARIAQALATGMNRQKFMEMLQDAFDTAKLMAEPASMVSAAREIGKACGYYEPQKVQVSVTGAIAVKELNRMSDSELLRLIEQGAAAGMEQLEAQEAQDDTPLLEDDTPLLEDDS